MKNRKKLQLLLLLIAICLLLFIFVQIYAKYLTAADGNTAINIARWNILVNNLSIKDNSDISASIVPVFPGNDNIASDIIAPTAEGYFDLDFDFSAADVSFEYEIKTAVAENSSVKDLVATGYSIDNGTRVTFTNYNDPISEQILLDSNIQKRKVRIYVIWNDDADTSQMTNADDTIATNSATPALFNVNISFTQIAG